MPRGKKNTGEEEVETSFEPIGFVDLYDEKNDRTLATNHDISTLAQGTSAILHQIIAQETASLARRFPRSKFDQGLSMADIETLVYAYAGRGPDEKSALLHALDIHPGYMASCFAIMLHSPPLPESDPVFQILEANQSKTEEWKERNRKTSIGGITVSDPSLWARTMTTLEERNILTLGDLANTNPFDLLSIKQFGKGQLNLCIELLYEYRLMTPDWDEAALKITSRNGSSARGKHAPERGK